MKNKKTNEEKNAKKLALIEERKQKRAEKKAAREAKRAAKLEKRRAMIELKKQKRAEKKAKKLARIQKQKERKAALREKKRLAREKKRNAEKALKLKLKAQKKQKTIVKVDKTDKVDSLDAKTIIANLNKLVKNEAKILSKLDADEFDKKIKKLEKLGYTIGFGPDGTLTDIGYSFSVNVKLNKKLKNINEQPVIEQPNENNEDEPKVEMIPAGDLLGTDGQVNEAEVANVDNDDDIIPTDDSEGDFEDEDDTIVDSRDETDIDLIESRREFFNNAADFGEDIDN